MLGVDFLPISYSSAIVVIAKKKGTKELSQCTSNKRSTRLPRQKDSSYEKEKLLLPRSMQTFFCHSLTGICSKPLLEDLA